MTKETNEIIPMILEELPVHHKKEFVGDNLMNFLEDKYGKPEVISDTPLKKESVFDIEEKKVGVIEDPRFNIITGYCFYKGDIPDGFIQKQQAPCVNGYTRTFTVTTTSPTLVVYFINPFQTIGALLQVGVTAAFVGENLHTHLQKIAAAKASACAPCAAPCTCTATTVSGAGTSAFTYTINSKWGIPYSANVVHVVTTTVSVVCA
ncbi:MAG: hypothetical protein GY729_17685 [Desulfobacteraceae bacterium]|nr:hypothetical protein [Desulfobacteraceae bacterium]